MKNLIKTAFVLTVSAAGICAYTATNYSSVNAAAAETASSALASPYGAHCASCHGRDGKANTPKGREMDADDLTSGKVQGMSTATLTRIIKNGKGDMPGFPNLSKAQIASIIKSVKAF